MRREARTLPWEKLLIFVLVFGGAMLLVIARSSSGSVSVFGVKCNSTEYWVLFSAIVPYSFVVSALIGTWLNRQHVRKTKLGFDYLKSDVKWNIRNLIFFSFVSILAGIISGFVGIG